MKSLTKLIITLAAVVVAMGVLTGCAKKDTPSHNLAAIRDKIYNNNNNTNGNNSITLPNNNSSSNNYSDSSNNNYSDSSNNNYSGSSNNNYSQSTSSTRLPLDTTGNYSGLRLRRVSTKNDLVGSRIRSSTTNMASRMTGTEPQLKVAVDAFENFKSSHTNFAAYKVMEYDTYSTSEVNRMNKILSGDKGTNFWRIVMEIYQYDEVTYGSSYTDTSADPYYFTVIIYQTQSGNYNLYSSVSSR